MLASYQYQLMPTMTTTAEETARCFHQHFGRTNLYSPTDSAKAIETSTPKC